MSGVICYVAAMCIKYLLEIKFKDQHFLIVYLCSVLLYFLSRKCGNLFTISSINFTIYYFGMEVIAPPGPGLFDFEVSSFKQNKF